ncbi:protein SPT2 homolog [Diceros bicornis minor]|uniref:protein SPT2 homolog n=1 Tax=Diceros bicornis minor TaxID=77932 RepID=UPI0026EB05C0|nr:protein SPT2 homolog [Diceros bicornis minor]
MDFREILLIASKGQGVNNVPKRYSLAVGPPKKDPKVKGVQSAAVQAFLRRKEEELRQKALEEKRRKEELVKKRIELKHDKKARAMAKRTKDNFHGYNGIPVEEKSKKRQAMDSHTSQGIDQEYEMEEEDEFLEYNQAESEQEYEEEQEPPKVESKPKVPLKSAPPLMNFTDLLRLAEKKQYEPVEIKVVKKTEERPMTAEELREREFLERKQRKKKPETDARLPPTKKAPSQKESMGTKLSKVSGDKHLSSKGTPLPHAEKKSRPSTGNEKQLGWSSSKSMPGERTKAGSGNCSQPSLREGHGRPVFNGAGKTHSSTSSPGVLKTSAKGTQKSATEHKAKKSPPHPSHSRPGPTVTPHSRSKSPGVRQPGSSSSSAPGRPSTGTAQPTVSSGPLPRRQNGSSNSGPERSVSGTKRPASDLYPSGRIVTGTSGPGRPASSSGGPGRPANSSSGPGRPANSSSGPGRPASSSSGPGRPASSSSGPGRPASSSGVPGRHISGSGGSGRPMGSSGGPGQPMSSPRDFRRLMSGSGPPGRSVSGPGRSVTGSVPAGRTVSSSGPGRPVSSLGPGRTVSSSGPPLKPKCTVVSETISSKNIISRSSNGQMNGMKPSLSGYRSAQGSQRLPFPSGYKRQREYEEEEDDEYDSEMEDFIEDEGEPQEEISKHIREIFGYDRKKYKDESDYALRYMESSWKEQQKEEAKSLRLGMQEDLEEMRREEEDMRRRKAKKLKRH